MPEHFAALLAAGLRRYPGRGKVALWKRVAPRLPAGQFTVTLSSGARMRLDTTKYWQRLMFAEAFERRSAWLVSRLLEPDDIFVDGGANCGFYACLAAGRVGAGGRVLAVEPDARLHAQLAEQVGLNPSITVVPAAFTDQTSTAPFHVPPGTVPDGWGLGIASLEPREGWRAVEVATITLDDLCRAQPRPVALAKLDLEGHEAQALAGAAAVLDSGQLESLLVEINDTRVGPALRHVQFDVMLDVRRGFTPVDDLARLDGSHTDVALLRGRCAERWRRWKSRARWV